MELKNLEVHNFRSFSDIKIRPTRLNIIVGRNNSGKTSLIEAISMVFNHTSEIRLFSQNPSLIINAERNENETRISAKTDHESTSILLKKASMDEVAIELRKFIWDKLKLFLSFELNSIKGTRKKTSNSKLADALSDLTTSPEFEKAVNNFTGTEEFLALAEKVADKSISINSGRDISIRTPKLVELFDSPVIEALSKLIFNYLETKDKTEFSSMERVILEDFRDFFRYNQLTLNHWIRKTNPEDLSVAYGFNSKLFKRISHSRTDDFNLNIRRQMTETESIRIEEFIKNNNLVSNILRFSFRSIVFKKGETTYEIPMELMGDGFIALVDLVRNISNEIEAKIVAIEEPERDLHPGYIEEFASYLVKLAKESGTQFFITTHSDDFLKEVFRLAEGDGPVANFIAKELSIVRLTKIRGNSICSVRSFSEARTELEELELDLRGV